MGVIESNEQDKPDEDLIDQLEASFQGNLIENFGPQQFEQLNSVKFMLLNFV